ncbi:MAG: ATP phosphoribosyltransferase [Dehalococcoidales bacterium]|nr:ATP phosphoribosyltransferase [Dehalococcoidales bacterium]
MKKQVKIALPKGRLLAETSRLLQAAGWGLNDYTKDTRLYHLQSTTYPDLIAKVFQERDIPVQVAIGNYDLGICGLDWVEEQLVKYPSSALVKIEDLGYGQGILYVVAGRFNMLSDIRGSAEHIRIASEYPNLAESFAAQNRLRSFSVYPVWGAAEAYPPESADLAMVSDGKIGRESSESLSVIGKVSNFSAYLIANRESWENSDLGRFLSSLFENRPAAKPYPTLDIGKTSNSKVKYAFLSSDIIRIAIPDGHQQSPTIDLLQAAGIQLEGYNSSGGNTRPKSNLEGVAFKVIRPQDMPLQVANGNFDLAITGRDWLRNHLYQFPTSPVEELLDLKSGWVRIVAVVSNNLPVDDTNTLRSYCSENPKVLRIASEYTNIADKYARDNHLGMYRIIPTWGATETFIPDDADMLIENTQTGKTLARHNLKIVDTLFESTGCLIGNTSIRKNKVKAERINRVITMLRGALGA